MSYAHTLKSLALTSSALCLIGTVSLADQVILDDLIVDGSICAGMDCVNGESFGFDTIRLKENNLRIRAVDTSSTSSFPSRDWQITFNDSANGGANKFSIDDIDGGRTPFTLEAGAPSHALYVDDGGRLGLGTSTPVVDVHVKSGNTPTLRLEQDGTSGFTPQTWDVAGNESNFFVRDATNGSTLPFRIYPGAPSNALTIEASGDIGVGISSPDANLHVLGSSGLLVEDSYTGSVPNSDAIATIRQNGNAVGGNPAVQIENSNAANAVRTLLSLSNNGGSRILMENTNNAAVWLLAHDNGGAFVLNRDGGNNELRLTSDGNLILTGTITTTGSCSSGCDRVFTEDYDLASIDDHSSEMWAQGYLPAVGPTAEDGPMDLSQKVGGMLNELEHAHIYIEQLNQRIAQLETKLDGKP